MASVGVRVRVLRCGPGLQDTARDSSPQNLLAPFLLSEWTRGPAEPPGRLASASRSVALASSASGESDQRAATRRPSNRSTTTDHHSFPPANPICVMSVTHLLFGASAEKSWPLSPSSRLGAGAGETSPA